VLDGRQDPELALLLRAHDLVRVRDLDRLGMPMEVREHHADLVDEVVEGDVGELGAVDHTSERVRRRHRGPATLPTGLVAPLVLAVTQVRDEILGRVRQHHRVLVEVHHDGLLHESPKARLSARV
jgi:hypothetical protein